MFWFFGVERKWSASLERFTITRIEKNTRTCFLQGWMGSPLSREKSSAVPTWKREKLYSKNSLRNFNHAQSMQIFTNYFSKKKKNPNRERRKSTRDMQFLERKIYSLNCHHEEKQQIPFHLRFLSRAGRLGEKNHGDRAIIFARICWQRATQMVEPRGWSADKTQNPRLTRGGGVVAGVRGEN